MATPPASFPPGPGVEIRALTGLRGVAALWVVLLHFQPEFARLLPVWSALDPLSGNGFLGVDIFFVLSGFILAHVHHNPTDRPWSWRELRGFYWLRLIRIYPVHLVTFLLVALQVMAARWWQLPVEGNYPLAAIPTNLTLTQAWPVLERLNGPAVAWNEPSWSVSAEWFAYLCVFPLLGWWRGSGGVGPMRHLGWVFLSLSALQALYLTKVLNWPSPVLMASLEFFAGHHLYSALRQRPDWVRQAGRGLPWLVAGWLVAFYQLDFVVCRILVVLTIPFLLAGLADGGNVVARLLARPAVRWLGIISYSIYLGHSLVKKPVLMGQRLVEVSDWAWYWRAAGCVMIFAAVIGFAALLYYLVERPARNGLRRLSGTA